jgi:hypothetical protein
MADSLIQRKSGAKLQVDRQSCPAQHGVSNSRDLSSIGEPSNSPYLDSSVKQAHMLEHMLEIANLNLVPCKLVRVLYKCVRPPPNGWPVRKALWEIGNHLENSS